MMYFSGFKCGKIVGSSWIYASILSISILKSLSEMDHQTVLKGDIGLR